MVCTTGTRASARAGWRRVARDETATAISSVPWSVGAGQRTAKRRRPPSRRRSPEEIAALGERLYEAICRHPGETMAVIAPVVGASPGELRRPSVLLRHEGSVRSVGQRHAMRYFPLGE